MKKLLAILRPLASLVILHIFVAFTAFAEDPVNQTVGQRAVSAVLSQVALDPTVIAPKTGKPLPVNGAWSIGKQAPESCPQGANCITVYYVVSEDDVVCQWVIDMGSDGKGEKILEQNENASHYLIRKVPIDQARALVVARKKPTYPPLAIAAHVQGEVVLRAYISDSGAVDHILIVSGPEMLRASAADALKAWTFKPLIAGTKPARFQTDVIFKFAGFSPGNVTSKP